MRFDFNVYHVTGGGVDYNSGPYTVTFPAGVTTVPFHVPITDDIILESNEDFNLIIDISSLPNDVTTGSPQQATVTIAEDDCKYIEKVIHTYVINIFVAGLIMKPEYYSSFMAHQAN